MVINNDDYEVTFLTLQGNYTLRKSREKSHTEVKNDEYEAGSLSDCEDSENDPDFSEPSGGESESTDPEDYDESSDLDRPFSKVSY